ncbi:hypothetical protein JNUCC83_07590 [Vagococcus sp. JNUCC 83]
MKKRVSKRILMLGSMVVCLLVGGIVVYASDLFWGGEDDIKGIEVVLDKLKTAVDSRDNKLKNNGDKLERELVEKESLKQIILEKEQSISNLNIEQENLESKITELNSTIETQKKNLIAKDDYREAELAENQAYYTGEINKYQEQVRVEEAEKNEVLEKMNHLNSEKEALDKQFEKLSKLDKEKDGKLEKARTDVKELREKADSILEEVNSNEDVQ